MFEFIIMIALLLIAAAVGAYLHYRRKVWERERRQQYDEFLNLRPARGLNRGPFVLNSAVSGRSSSSISRREDPMSGPLHPLNPIGFTSPLSPLNQLNTASHSDDSATRSYSCDSSSSWSSSDSGSSSSDSGSSYSSCD